MPRLRNLQKQSGCRKYSFTVYNCYRSHVNFILNGIVIRYANSVLHSAANVLWCTQMTRLVFCRLSQDWSINSQTLLSRTLGCWMSCWGWRCWVAERSLMLAVRERCIEETTPCLSCWHQKTSAASFWPAYGELVNIMLSTLSHKTEVSNTMMIDVLTYFLYQSNVSHPHGD